MSAEAAEELLRLLESGRLPPADVLILDHMKTLLLLQDTERLTSALKMFPEHCMMPPGKHHSAYPSGSGCKTTPNRPKTEPTEKGASHASDWHKEMPHNVYLNRYNI